jgi:hypothetical protein
MRTPRRTTMARTSGPYHWTSRRRSIPISPVSRPPGSPTIVLDECAVAVRLRKRSGRAQFSVDAIDSASISSSDTITAGRRSCNPANKTTNRPKRQIDADTLGLLLPVLLTRPGVQDRHSARFVFRWPVRGSVYTG